MRRRRGRRGRGRRSRWVRRFVHGAVVKPAMLDNRTAETFTETLRLADSTTAQEIKDRLSQLGVKHLDVSEHRITGKLGNAFLFRFIGVLFRVGRNASPGLISIDLVTDAGQTRADVEARYSSGFSPIKVPGLRNVFREQFDELIGGLSDGHQG